MNHKHYRRMLSDSFYDLPLEKGVMGDWQKEGYKITHEGNPKSGFKVLAMSPKGKIIGKVPVAITESKRKPILTAENPTIHVDHRRKGLASAMYQYAENISGGIFKPDLSLTLSAKKMWAKPDRPFGGKKKYFQHLISKSEELDKGAKGDWQKEGYTIEHFIDKDGFHNVRAYDKNSNPVGYASFSYDYVPDETGTRLTSGDLRGWDVKIHPDHQRKGLATAMYKLAEKNSGKKVIQGGTTPEGSALWSQPNRPFGKSEELDKGAKGDWQKEGYKIIYTPDKSSPHVTYHNYKIIDKNKKKVGSVSIVEQHTKDPSHMVSDISNFYPSYTKIDPHHQRKGLASAVYTHAEKKVGKKLDPSEMQTPDAEKLWSQPNRPFGKSEELDKITKGFEELFGFLAKAKANIIYIATDGDNIGASVERAALSNDIKEIKKQDKIIKRGNQTIRKWIKKRKGSIYIDGGDDISFTIHKKYLDEIEELRNKYHEATGYTITVGVGDSISEAAHAMIYGKLKGKNQVNRWTPEIESIISQHDKKPETAEEKYQKEGLLAQKPNK